LRATNTWTLLALGSWTLFFPLEVQEHASLPLKPVVSVPLPAPAPTPRPKPTPTNAPEPMRMIEGMAWYGAADFRG
jgi:hypothetical protein